jgi:hypothetical protein
MKPGSVKFTSGNTILQDDGYSNLVSSSAGIETIYGNVFYDRGFVVLTKDVNGPIISGSSFVSYSLDFRSTKTIYENEIFISVLESEFNVSTNPTALVGETYDTESVNYTYKNYDGSSGVTTINYYNLNYARINPLFWEYDFSASNDPTGSYLAPYITTIGLYDDDMNMVAVAKLPQPIKSLPDYPLNFIIRFDT